MHGNGSEEASLLGFQPQFGIGTVRKRKNKRMKNMEYYMQLIYKKVLKNVFKHIQRDARLKRGVVQKRKGRRRAKLASKRMRCKTEQAITSTDQKNYILTLSDRSNINIESADSRLTTLSYTNPSSVDSGYVAQTGTESDCSENTLSKNSERKPESTPLSYEEQTLQLFGSDSESDSDAPKIKPTESPKKASLKSRKKRVSKLDKIRLQIRRTARSTTNSLKLSDVNNPVEDGVCEVSKSKRKKLDVDNAVLKKRLQEESQLNKRSNRRISEIDELEKCVAKLDKKPNLQKPTEPLQPYQCKDISVELDKSQSCDEMVFKMLNSTNNSPKLPEPEHYSEIPESSESLKTKDSTETSAKLSENKKGTVRVFKRPDCRQKILETRKPSQLDDRSELRTITEPPQSSEPEDCTEISTDLNESQICNKRVFKRPNCRRRVLETPKSPEPENYSEMLIPPPKLIPLTKPKPLPVATVNYFFKKLLTHPEAPEVVEEVAQKVSTQEALFLAK